MNPIECDVLASGGGMAGTVAAVAAARQGARTVLFERHGFLGGAATAGAVGQFVGWETRSGRRVIAGIAEEIVERLQKAGASTGHGSFIMSTGHRMDRVEYDTEILKVVLDEIAYEAGVRVLLHSQLAQASRRGRAIGSATLLTKGGLLDVRARVFIDASGDLDLMARVGAPFLVLEAGESLQPATMMFRLGPIDFALFDDMSFEAKAALSARGVAEGALPRAALHCSRVPGSDDGWFNVTRIAIDASDPFALSDGEREGRRQALAAARFIATHVPGCSRARLVSFAPQLGIRETRRIAGLATLTADDLRNGAEFIDAMALGAYPIDVHHAGGAAITFEELGPDHVYALPYRIAVPQGLDNVLVAGRGLSATHEAHGAIRVMPTAMAVAHAVGTAAALTAASNQPAASLDPATLREKLRAAGAIL
ncbi:MAG: FAD-dependent oxidoreductase [Reyranella sp.]|uniref:FAD-dependent oxidoreductase n=1 Tax=Reyranella sp. TaxID=1929291 RepID=UPI003D0C9C38